MILEIEGEDNLLSLFFFLGGKNKLFIVVKVSVFK